MDTSNPCTKLLWSGLFLYHIEIARKELGNQDLHEYHSLLQPIFYAFYYKNATYYQELCISILLFQLRYLLYSLYTFMNIGSFLNGILQSFPLYSIASQSRKAYIQFSSSSPKLMSPQVRLLSNQGDSTFGVSSNALYFIKSPLCLPISSPSHLSGCG